MGTCSSSFFGPQITSKDSKQKTKHRNLETEIDLNSTRSQHFSIPSKDSSSTKTVQFKDQNTKEKESFLGLSSDSEKETQYSSSFETLHSSSVENHSNLKSNLHSAGKEAQSIPQNLGDKVEYKTQNTKEKERYNNSSASSSRPSSDSEETRGTFFKSERGTSSLKTNQRLNQAPFKEKETPYSSSFETLHSSSVENTSSLKSNLHSAGKEAQLIPQYLGDKAEYRAQNTKEKERYKNPSASSSRPSSDSDGTQDTLFKSKRRTSSVKINQRLNQTHFKEKETPYSSSLETHTAGKESQLIPECLGEKDVFQDAKER